MYLFSGNQVAQMAWRVTWRGLEEVEERLGQRLMPPLHVFLVGRIRRRQQLQIIGQFFGRPKVRDTNDGVGVGQKVVHVGRSPIDGNGAHHERLPQLLRHVALALRVFEGEIETVVTDEAPLSDPPGPVLTLCVERNGTITVPIFCINERGRKQNRKAQHTCGSSSPPRPPSPQVPNRSICGWVENSGSLVT